MPKVKIILNGEDRFVEQNTNLQQLVLELELDCKKIAIEKDLEIVNPQNFSEILLQEGSKIEIVHFIGGG